jgi:hypothetical protein
MDIALVQASTILTTRIAAATSSGIDNSEAWNACARVPERSIQRRRRVSRLVSAWMASTACPSAAPGARLMSG